MSKMLKSLAMAAMALCVWAGAAQASVIVSDFSKFNNSGNLLLPSATNTREVTISPNNPGTYDVRVTHASGIGAGQSAFLSSEYPTYDTAGMRISVELTTVNFQGTSGERIGLAIASTDQPTNRNNTFNWAWRKDGVNNLALETFNASGTAASTLTTFSTKPHALFIEKAATGWSFGVTSSTGVDTYYHTGITSVGAVNLTADGTAIGLWTDMRANTTVYQVTKLTVIPEPASGLLLLAGAVGLGVLRKKIRG